MVEEGLRRLLTGTGLGPPSTGPRTYSVVLASANSNASPDVGEAVAAAGVSALDESLESGEEIVVTGTNIRGIDVPAPTTTVDRAEFANSGPFPIE